MYHSEKVNKNQITLLLSLFLYKTDVITQLQPLRSASYVIQQLELNYDQNPIQLVRLYDLPVRREEPVQLH